MKASAQCLIVPRKETGRCGELRAEWKSRDTAVLCCPAGGRGVSSQESPRSRLMGVGDVSELFRFFLVSASHAVCWRQMGAALVGTWYKEVGGSPQLRPSLLADYALPPSMPPMAACRICPFFAAFLNAAESEKLSFGLSTS